MIAPCIYTTGFAGQDFALLPGLLDYLDAVLIDIRFAPPTSGRQVEWRKDYLRRRLKDRYRHVPHLGVRFSKERDRLAIQNLALGVRIIAEMRANLVLMCECQTKQACHRAVISESLKRHGFTTQEIANWSPAKQPLMLVIHKPSSAFD